MGGGNGNYGCFGLVDFATGTNIGADSMDDVIDEAEEKQVAKKMKRKVKTGEPKILKNAPKKKHGWEREQEEEGGERGAEVEEEKEEEANAKEEEKEKENEEEEQNEELHPRLKTKGTGVNMSGKMGANTHDEDANAIPSVRKNESPRKKRSRTRRGEKEQ